MKLHLLLLSLGGIFLASSCHCAVVQFTGQNRFTELRFTSLDGDAASVESASNFDLFHSNQSSNFTIGGSSAFAAASQRSLLGPYSIVATGTALGTVGPPAGSSGAAGRSHFEIDFFVSQAAPFEFAIESMNAEFGRVIFYGPSVEIDSAFGLANGRADFLLAEERVFQAGNYRASIEITNGGAAEGFTGSYRLTVQQIPEPPFHCLLFSFTAGIFLRRVKPSLRSVRTKCCS